MKYFLDTEFIEDGKTIDLLSIALVAEDGRHCYYCNQDAKLDRAGEWIIFNVYPHLPLRHSDKWYWVTPKIDVDNRSTAGTTVMPHWDIRDRVKEFLSNDPKPEIWAYYADYDWVVFCQLFGRMVDLPPHFPRYCMDVKQLSKMLGDPRLPKQEGSEHHALADAKWTKDTFIFLQGLYQTNPYRMLPLLEKE